jgi:hypothetical protein
MYEDVGTMQCGARQLIVIEQPTYLTNASVASQFELLQTSKVLLELLGIRERDTIQALQRGVFGIGQPVGTRVLHTHHTVTNRSHKHVRYDRSTAQRVGWLHRIAHTLVMLKALTRPV